MKIKKKVLILVPHYLPGNKLGGPLTSIINMVENLSDDFMFFILTTDRDFGDKEPYKDIETNSWIEKGSYYINYLPQTKYLIIDLIKTINQTPHDVLYLNSFFDPYFSILIIFSKKIKFLYTKNVIIAPRGEAYDEALGFRTWKKRIYLYLSSLIGLYKRDVYFHASTENEKKLIVKNFGIKPEKIHVAINMTVKENNSAYYNQTESRFKKDSILNIVFLSRISKDKNLVYTFEILRHIKKNVIFDIYGPIEDGYIWRICEEKIKDLPNNIIVNYKGIIKKNCVKKTLSKYNLMFLPTFAENYGHAIVESLSVGTPVLISDNTPWRNLEVDGIGWDLNLNSPELFIDAINMMVNNEHNLKNRGEIAKIFNARLNDPLIYSANKQLFSQLL